MLNQPNEKIYEIWKDACREAFPSDQQNASGKTASTLAKCIIMLILICIIILCLIDKSGKLFLFLAFVFGIVMLFRSLSSHSRNPEDKPAFFMFHIMRIVGEILSEDWGEYTVTRSKGKIVKSKKHYAHRYRSEDLIHCVWKRDGEKLRTLHYSFNLNDDDHRDWVEEFYYICLEHPILTKADSLDPSTPLYEELKYRLHGGDLITFEDINQWCRTFIASSPIYNSNFQHNELSSQAVGGFNYDHWFEFACKIAVLIKENMDNMECVMDRISQKISEDENGSNQA